MMCNEKFISIPISNFFLFFFLKDAALGNFLVPFPILTKLILTADIQFT